MSVNTLGIEQAYQLIKELHDQATGQEAITPTDLSSFISVANTTLAVGTDKLMGAITDVLERTYIAVRPYDRKFKGLEFTSAEWGGYIRKISYVDGEPVADPTFELVEGQSYDPWTVHKPKVVETHYYGSYVYMPEPISIFTEQLKPNFASPEAFGAWMSGLMTHLTNEREQWAEESNRAMLANLIGAKKVLETNDPTGQHVVHLLTEYNQATGLSLTAQTVRQPANYPGFVRWMYARVERISKLMTERSGLFQLQLTGKPINRHTPVADQRIYFDADLKAHMEAEVLSDTYHDNYLQMAETEGVSYWQSILNPTSVSVTPAYIGADGKVVEKPDAVVVNNIAGIIFDRDALGYNIYQNTIEQSPYNPVGQYYNLYPHARMRSSLDLTEKSVLLLLD